MICLNKDFNLSKQIVFLWFCFSLYTVTKITSCFNLKKISCLKILILKLQLVFSHSVNLKFSSVYSVKNTISHKPRTLTFVLSHFCYTAKKKKTQLKYNNTKFEENTSEAFKIRRKCWFLKQFM